METGLRQLCAQRVLVFVKGKRGGGRVALGNAQGGNTALYNAVQRLAHFVVCGQAGELFLFFALFKRFVCPAAHAVELHRFRERQLLANAGKAYVRGFVRQREKLLPLRLRQWARFAVFRKADVVDFLQQRKVFKRIGGFCRARLIRLECAAAHHFFHLVASVGAVAARPLVKRTLAQKNGKIFRLQLRCGPAAAHCTLALEQDGGLLCHHIPPDGGKVIVSLIALVKRESLVPVQHFAHGAPATLGHAPAVFVHGGQKPPILAVRGGSAVAFKPAALGKVQQNARKFGLADRFVQRARAQRIDVFQAARFKHLRELFPGGKATAFQQGVNVRTAQRLAAQTAAHPARHAPRRGKAFARLGLLGLVENAYTQTVQSNRFARAVQTDDGPADRRHADVQPDAIQCVFHITASFTSICMKRSCFLRFHLYHDRITLQPSISTVDKNIRVFWAKKMTPR